MRPPLLKRLLLAVLLPAFFITSAMAKPPSHRYTRLTVEDGLLSNYVKAICQDREGFMWIGTQGGLQRYDGRQFEYIPLTGISTLPQGEITHISEIRPGVLLILSNTSAFTYNYATRQTRLLELEGVTATGFRVTRVLHDREKNIWLCTAHHGAYLLREQEGKFIPFYSLYSNTRHLKIMQIEQAPGKDRYWLGTNQGIGMLDLGEKTVYTPDHNPRNIPLLKIPALRKTVTQLFADSRQGLFICTWPSGQEFPDYFRYDESNGQLFTGYGNLGGIDFMMRDRSGHTWSAGNKLLRFSADGRSTREFPRDPNSKYGLDYTDLFTIAEDNMGNLWLGTSHGIYIFNYARQQFHSIEFKPEKGPQPPPPVEITDLWQHPGGDIWVTSWGQGLLIYDSTLTHLKKHIHGTDYHYNMLWCIQPLPDGRVLIGGQHARVLEVNGTTWQSRQRYVDGIDNRTIRRMTLAPGGDVWIGASHGVVARWNVSSNKLRKFTDSTYASGKYTWGDVMDIYAGPRQDIWVGTATHGLLRMDTAGHVRQRYSWFDPLYKLPANNVRALHPLPGGKMLVAGGGIALLDIRSGTMTAVLTEKNGLPMSHITNVLPINNREVFFTTNFSAGKVNLETGSITHFGRNDGIADESFQLPSAIRLHDGRIAFGSARRVFAFHPDSLPPPQRPPDIQIQHFKSGDDTYDRSNPLLRMDTPRILLSHQRAGFTVGFMSPAYLEQDNLTYHYQLEGIDEDWVNAGKRQYASYTNLPPGEYTFRLYCLNGEGLGSQKITTMYIVIQKPIWQKGWFYGVVALLLTGIVYGVHRLRINHILATEKVRSRIARDLHDDMGSTLTSINIMSSMAGKSADRGDMVKTRDFISKIGESTTRMMESMDDIVWSINPLNDSTPRVIARMREFTTSVLEARGIGFSFTIDDKIYNRKLQLENRHDFFMIYKETITNIAKYAQCTFADIRIQLRKGQLVLRVQDNGVGFNVNEAGDGDGLMNMQRRAYRMNGQFSIQSQLGKGTVVTLMFPTT
ncbi:sensor histidine kinase [Chitinophaga deserti]|uniref:sensor histidine kinase n=1 Tax=Chitinophaga deserti TaxID=2164099 RepID=UPI000D6C7CE0|nr:sensor histidine kinase [Chitinophaga deserti]